MRNSKLDPRDQEHLELQRTLGWMDLVIGSITDAVYVIDKDKRIVFANLRFSELVKTPRVFLLGLHIDDVFKTHIPPKAKIEEIEKLFAVNNFDGDSFIVREWVDSETTDYTFRISYRELETTGQTVHVAHNITQDYELANMKNTFIDLASHQLRTPMTAIMTYSHMLFDGYAGELRPDQKKLAGILIKSSERMTKLVNDLLTITRIQNTLEENTSESVYPEELLKKITAELSPLILSKKIKLRVVVEEDLLPLIIPESILHEIISNIIVNSVQYTKENGKITVKAVQKDANLVISITDNGIGIPESYIPKMFTQFMRAENAMAYRPEGTGLGLYVIKILIDKINGKIACTSKLGKGTKFTISLPIPKIIR